MLLAISVSSNYAFVNENIQIAEKLPWQTGYIFSFNCF